VGIVMSSAHAAVFVTAPFAKYTGMTFMCTTSSKTVVNLEKRENRPGVVGVYIVVGETGMLGDNGVAGTPLGP
jgi:hypothetical protein